VSPAHAEIEPDAIVLRHCSSPADYAAVFALQAETWGHETGVLVSTPILKVSQRVGGITAGAFAPDGTLLGLVFGLTGPQGNRLVHWSDMLAVRAGLRDHGIGRRLKEFQRAECARMGVDAIQWTYDPLVARNAHLNLMRLGAWPVEYVEEMYADSDSPLHVGLGTDRFVVEWPTDPARIVRATVRSAIDAPSLTDGRSVTLEQLGSAPHVSVPVPGDIHAVAARDPIAARQWRQATRAAFQSAMRAGYRACGFVGGADVGHYYFAAPERTT
jgi:chorismate synthase